jgi:Kef-type K+ transport system membrane component KefB
VLLTCIAWILFLVFAVRPVFLWLLRRSGSIQNGPTQGMMTLTILLVLTSSWFTGVIGVHPIFGGKLEQTSFSHLRDHLTDLNISILGRHHLSS